MHPFSDIANRVMRFAGVSLARQERGDRGPQPVELIPGMPAAPEPCCLPAAHWTHETHPRGAIAQPKIDGIRAIALQTRVVTRQALPFDAALHCLPALDRLERKFGEPMVFDGEYQEPEGHAATLAAHKRGLGCGTFYLFDAVPYAEWKTNRFTQPLDERLERIGNLAPGDEPFLAFLPPVDVPSADHAIHFAGQAWARGTEGLVVKKRRGIYTRGRSSDWLKLKRTASLDGPVMDVVVPGGDTKRAVALVRLAGKTHRVAAMPEDIRHLTFFDHMGADGGLTGRMVEVAFNEITDTGALRGARILRLRPDKPKGE